MSRWIYAFAEELPAGADARELLGGKGLSLREMSGAGLEVPPGFTITTACCAEYYRLGRRWPAGLEEELRAQLAALEVRCGRTFGAGARPLLVSVRSGAARSMPGMMDTLLNCGLHPGLAAAVGDTPRFWALYRQFVASYAKTVHKLDPAPFEEDEGRSADRCLARYLRTTGVDFPTTPWDCLVACVDAVFASWENERAIAYRRRHRIAGLAGTAVNVQAMFPSQVSGIVFTRDPTAPQVERLVVESAWGLGESVVSGDVTPDRFLVDRHDFDVVEEFLGHKGMAVGALGDDAARQPDASSLDRAQLRRLCELGLRVEEHFGHPVDVEFGLADGELALLQARAVRGLDLALAIEPARQAEIERLRDLARRAGHRKVWVAHNLGETLVAPTPLTWDIVSDFMRGDGGFGRMYQRLGFRPDETVRAEGFLELICGRVYADPDRLTRLFWPAMPLVYDLESVAADPDLLEGAPGTFDPGRADGTFLLRLLPTLTAMWRSGRTTRWLRRHVAERYETEVLPAWQAWVASERGRDLGALGATELLALLDQRIGKTLHDFGPESLLPGYFGGLAFAALSARLEGLLGPDEGRALAATLTQALDGDVTFEMNAQLAEVGRGELELAAVVERHGHRCVGEMELARERHAEDDGFLRQAVERLRTVDPREAHRANRARRDAAEATLPETLACWGGSCFFEQVRTDLAEARRLLPYRENGKHELMKGYALIRAVVQELAVRWELGYDIYFLRREELAAFPDREAELRAAAADRRLRHEAWLRLEPARVVDSEDLERLGLAPGPGDATSFVGTAVAAGRATGPVRVVDDPGGAGELGSGYVLVCRSTDPGWTPLFVNACALVVERGGVLSHGAIVARDVGIPAVVLPDATRILPDGAAVLVDGDGGRVAVVETEDEL